VYRKHQLQLVGLEPLPPPPPRRYLLVPGALQAVHDAAQPDVQQPDLSVQVVDFLFQWAGPAPPTPVRSDGPRHEVHRHDEAEGQHRALRVTLKLLQDVEAGQGEERDTRQPEEAPEHSVQQVKEPPQEHGEEPVGHQDHGNQEQGARRRVGERCGAEVVAEVWGYREEKEEEAVSQ